MTIGQTGKIKKNNKKFRGWFFKNLLSIGDLSAHQPLFLCLKNPESGSIQVLMLLSIFWAEPVGVGILLNHSEGPSGKKGRRWQGILYFFYKGGQI